MASTPPHFTEGICTSAKVRLKLTYLFWWFEQQQQQKFYFFYINASTIVNTDTVRPGGGEKTLRSSRLPPPRWDDLGGGRRNDRSVFLPSILCLYWQVYLRCRIKNFFQKSQYRRWNYERVFYTCTYNIDSFPSASGRVVITKDLMTELGSIALQTLFGVFDVFVAW